MPPRFRTSILFAFALLFLYLVFPLGRTDAPYEKGGHVVDLLKDNGAVQHEERPPPPPPPPPQAPVVHTKEKPAPSSTSPIGPAQPASSVVGTSSAGPDAASTSASSVTQEIAGTSASSAVPGTASPAAGNGVKFQQQFNEEYEALELKESAGRIYGNTLKNLVSAGNHAGFAAAALSPTDKWTAYNDAPPLNYNPYPEYNNKAWNATNQGTYVACPGPDGEVKEVKVFSGHPEAFEDSGIGSYIPLEIDSNLCFERESRLGAYGYEEGDAGAVKSPRGFQKRTDWEAVNWGQLQKFCYEKNAGRYATVESMPSVSGDALNDTAVWPNGTVKARDMDADDHIEDEAEARKNGLHGMPQVTITAKSRTAVLLRACSGKDYTENDKQNIRSLVTELSLRSGGEYQVYLLVQIMEDVPIWTDAAAHEKAVHDNVPQEFWDMTVLWNDASMKEWYPLIPENANKANQSQWLSIQKFAQENPQFEFYWNWELDSRYTGHHYNLLEKLATFAQAQPRKYLWERNERYYIPSFHGPYGSKFRQTVEADSGLDTIWGPPRVPGVAPVGSGPPVVDPKEGTYEWGVGEEADYISLAPIFNPVGTTWPGRDDVWGYDGAERTPRRASIGTHSRCSKRLLSAMHEENKKGNHVSSEMAPQTVALLHSLKAVYAPIPIFFDREWAGEQLNKWFNPGPKGVSGSTLESPFSWERETRFEGSTWYDRALPPMRLYNNWMGWEDSGVGGAEWEKSHGRTCLPPMLLHPIKDVTKPPPGHRSKSDLPHPKP